MKFLDHYNQELRMLREAGMRFARAHPQVAAGLGLHPDVATDPFVERLLEGVAFLCARVQVRLDQEGAEFAEQALARLCPLFLSATPAITTFAFEPDLGAPDVFRGRTLPRGSLIVAHLPGRKLPVTFATARDVMLWPLKLVNAQCRHSLTDLPGSLAQQVGSAKALLRLRFALEGAATIGELRNGEGDIPPLHVSLAGDLPRAYALQQAILAGAQAWYAVVPTDRGDEVLPLPLSGLRLSGVDADEALLPDDIGGLPGLRVLREYFAQPTRLLGIYLDALAPMAATCASARSFDLVIALNDAAGLIGAVDATQFRLYASPAINLYPRRFDSVPYDPDVTEQLIRVDRMAPAAYHLWRFMDVRVCMRGGLTYPARPVLAPWGQDGADPAISYSLRRMSAPSAEEDVTFEGGDVMASDDYISVSTGGAAISLDEIASIMGKAWVADRNWSPSALMDAELRLLNSTAIEKIECLWPASVPRAIPSVALCWDAISQLGRHPLACTLGQHRDVTARVLEQVRLGTDPSASLDARRLSSLRAVRLLARFMTAGRASSLAVVASTCVDIDVDRAAHSDGGAWLFGRMLAQVLAESVALNDGIEVRVRLDAQVVSTHSNLRSPNGRLQ